MGEGNVILAVAEEGAEKAKDFGPGLRVDRSALGANLQANVVAVGKSVFVPINIANPHSDLAAATNSRCPPTEPLFRHHSCPTHATTKSQSRQIRSSSMKWRRLTVVPTGELEMVVARGKLARRPMEECVWCIEAERGL